ncbi:succinate dehydrogenase/fumarate reductase iron-sulfur subunit [Geobacter sulfurreducens]|jgi:succinate dehydrogenase / fumarate reductase iron-sulfur subunit|uniref:Succinate dehydrogenase/fumarate reductase, iron-sulfur protein n=1 Tax=Geobacter sulfurreducens (strain ATCC 51573 / DSM 12127 / PCA) TaxID=243231 RepID=Q74DY7_GEOSL|nr:succinate dehydrogenase/fumarate reductase iron-sulfur subunit [Geobacter sulfurreducens]AAR34554.1 succinate dehydrogenase/fumarate reductase, iron-sulfur protein [Geobacter sulfurreducens PCA]ADI84015.1 succinate dehydrogenase/fumarate reductase, iron-sulfur protein [Geobacter sulfurreducens KN400]AJY70897.1 succinate dehydrogenase [Geobacter sulfurreducens]BBA69704.1 Fumarate reductase iron-sulfur subunit [Geobacter sulfurreducens]HBB69235.1 succinate dehydrogenase/fumarate reductase iro
MSHHDKNMTLTLHVWRQKGPKDPGKFEVYEAKDVSPDQSFLEMLDDVNEELIKQGKDPIAFDHDCREGICGMCSQVINGIPHGGMDRTTVCQLHMRMFKNGDAIYIEPWRARAFPIIKDLVVDRGALDTIIQAGGYTSAHTGGVADGNALLIPKDDADYAMDAAECIGCGACVAGCPNGSAMLFTSAKVSQLAVLPQGKAEATRRVKAMTETLQECGFGNCTNHYECQAACPKGINVKFIATLNREYLKSLCK